MPIRESFPPLHLDAAEFLLLFKLLGPSLGLWRAAEIAVLRAQAYPPPVLDVGCGDGLVTAFVLARVAIGLDPDGEAVGRAAGRGVYGRFVTAPVEEARLPEASIGTVVSNSVFEHLERPDAVLAAVARVLRPGGCLVFTTPTEAFARWLALPCAPYAARRNRQLVHRHLWPACEWARRLAGAGLAVETVRPYLRRPWVWGWDVLELAQQVSLGRRRLFGPAWRRLPPAALAWLARRAAGLDLGAPEPGGGRLIVARKR